MLTNRGGYRRSSHSLYLLLIAVTRVGELLSRADELLRHVCTPRGGRTDPTASLPAGPRSKDQEQAPAFLYPDIRNS